MTFCQSERPTLFVQVITYKGFYSASSEWMGIENVLIVGSMCASSTLGRRFCSLVHLCSVNVPEDLAVVFTSYLTTVLSKICPQSNAGFKSKISKLASTMIAIYTEVTHKYRSFCS